MNKIQKLRDLEWKLTFVESKIPVEIYIKVYSKLKKQNNINDLGILKIPKICYKCKKKIRTIRQIGFEHEGLFLCKKCK